MFPHFTGPAERAMGTAGQWSHSWLSLWGSVLVGPGSEKLGKLEAGNKERGQERRQSQAAALSSRYFHMPISLFFLTDTFYQLKTGSRFQAAPTLSHPVFGPQSEPEMKAAHFADQQTVPLRELIRKAHCTPHTYSGPGSPWQSHGKRTVTLSMAGNLEVRTEQIVGCFGLEATSATIFAGRPLRSCLTPPSLPGLIPNQREQLTQNNNYLFCLIK